MPEIMPEFDRANATTAFESILDKLSKQEGQIQIGDIIKDITVLTTDQKERKVLESDFDRIAVLANIMKAMGEKGLEGVLAKVKKMPPADQAKFKGLLKAIRKSEVFDNLNHSERRVINSAYRAVAFQEKSVPVLSKITDFVKEIWRDFHASEISVAERKEIENILTDLVPEHESQKPDFCALCRFSILLMNAESKFGIKTPSEALNQFAKIVGEKTKKFLSPYQAKEKKKGGEEERRTQEKQEQARTKRQEQAEKKKRAAPAAEERDQPGSEKPEQSKPAEPQPEPAEKPEGQKIAEFKEWFLNHMTGEQEDAILKLEQANPEYKEFCNVARWAVASIYQDFDKVLDDCSRGKLTRQQFVERCTDISRKFNQYVSPTPTKDVKGEKGGTVLSLRTWLGQRHVDLTDLTDPRVMFLNGFHDLFRSFHLQIRSKMQEVYGPTPQTGAAQLPKGSEEVEAGEEFCEADEDTVLRYNEVLERLELPSRPIHERDDKWHRVISWYHPGSGRRGQDILLVPSPDSELTENTGEGVLTVYQKK